MYSYGAGTRSDVDAGTMAGWDRPSERRADQPDLSAPNDHIRELWQQSVALREQSRQVRAVSHELRAISRSIRSNLKERVRDGRR